jgi:plasmid stabilization system protein ParE
VKIEIAPRALLDAERCARWWREHRPAAGDLFEDELRAALDRIRTFPLLGSAYEAMPGRTHMRLLMPVTRHHVYYRIVAPDCVRIVAIWSAVRGRGPAV